MLRENNPDATRMSISRVYHTWHFVVFAMYGYVCLEACDYRAFVARMTNRHGHPRGFAGLLLITTVYVVLDVDGWKEQFF